MKVTGTLALVTGASSGIGAATARELAREGARVLLLARTREALDRVAREITDAGGSAKVHSVDLADAPAVQQAASAIKAESGTPDILVNSAGAGRPLFTEETSPAEAAQMIAVPYLGAFNLTRAFLPDVIRRGRGHIVNVSSVAAFFAVPGMTGYTAARWAMRGFTEALRQDLHGTGVGVTLVAPGLVSGTGYYEHNPGTAERVPKAARLYPTLTTQQLAAAIVRGIERNKTRSGDGPQISVDRYPVGGLPVAGELGDAGDGMEASDVAVMAAPSTAETGHSKIKPRRSPVATASARFEASSFS